MTKKWFIAVLCAMILLSACSKEETETKVAESAINSVEEPQPVTEDISDGNEEKIGEETTKQEEKDMSISVEEVKETTAGGVDATQGYALPENITSPNAKVTYGEMVTIEYNSTTVGCTRKANVLLPPDYDQDKSYPLLVLLHGIGGDRNEWLGAKPKQLIGNMIARGEAVPAIVVIPNVRARVNDAGNPSDIFTIEHFQAFDNFINDLKVDLLPYLEDNYKLLEGRENKAIAGLSMGGREALYIGLTLQETFGAIGAFSPAFGLLPYTNMNVKEEGLLKEEGFSLQPGFESTFIMIATGDNDGVVRDEPFKYHQAFENNKVPHIYYELPGGGHDFNVWTNGLYHFSKEIFKN